MAATKPTLTGVQEVVQRILEHATRIIAERSAGAPDAVKPDLAEMERILNESVAMFTSDLVSATTAALTEVIQRQAGPTAKRDADLA